MKLDFEKSACTESKIPYNIRMRNIIPYWDSLVSLLSQQRQGGCRSRQPRYRCAVNILDQKPFNICINQ